MPIGKIDAQRSFRSNDWEFSIPPGTFCVLSTTISILKERAGKRELRKKNKWAKYCSCKFYLVGFHSSFSQTSYCSVFDVARLLHLNLYTPNKPLGVDLYLAFVFV